MGSVRRAKDVMRREVITVSAAMDVWELARLLTTSGITGAPVVNDGGELIGVVSQTDIVRHLKGLVQSNAASADFYSESEHDPAGSERRVLRARDLMNPVVVRADEETTVHDLALIMTKQRVHRVIITRGQKIVGIVTSLDLIKAL